MQLLRQGDVGDDDRVEGAGGVLGSLAGVAAGVVLVLALGIAFPRHAALGDVDGVLGGGTGGRAACDCDISIACFDREAPKLGYDVPK